MLQVAEDPRYKGRAVVHMGDSAGGWMSLRFRQLLCGIVLGEEEDFKGMEEKAQMLLDGLGPSILISPCVNFEITPAVLEQDKKVSS